MTHSGAMNEPRRTLSPRTRWAVPVVAAVAVGMAFAAPPLFASADDAGLPTISPEELAAQVASAEPSPLSGTVVYTARLGLPEIPFGAVGGADPINLLGGSSTMRVWSDGEQRSRVALLGPTSEYSVVQDGAEAWTYSSSDDAVVHYSLSDADAARYEALAALAEAGELPVHADLPTPEEAGRQAVERAEESSTVTLDAQTEVAGRAAYQLVVTPTSDTTLVGRIVVAVDAETSTPLRVQVWSTSDTETPALEIGFTDVSFATPADSVLAFSAPAGASTREVVVPLPEVPAEAATATPDKELPEGVTVTGTGWDAVVQASGLDVAALVAGDPSAAASLPGVDKTFGSQGAADLYSEFVPEEGSGSPMGDLDTTALYDTLTTEVPEGRLLSSALLSVLVTDDGRVLVGAVPGATLQALAAP
ncbi:membrane protein [Cellulomonas terrae]|uniref:Membrane protein n=2 Tax=Cellulomonas terrae TaxID=311234 RepID=A0A511JLD6_9CELL|nr:membrane protein [Cellulomonas terrae]